MFCGLVFREKRTIEGGGYYYVYNPVSPEKVAAEMRKMLNELCNKFEEAIKDFLAEFGSSEKPC